jgi:hypothetical protein
MATPSAPCLVFGQAQQRMDADGGKPGMVNERLRTGFEVLLQT